MSKSKTPEPGHVKVSIRRGLYNRFKRKMGRLTVQQGFELMMRLVEELPEADRKARILAVMDDPDYRRGASKKPRAAA